MNEGFGKNFYRKANSMKRFGPFTEPSDSENRNIAVLIPFPKIGSYFVCLNVKGLVAIPLPLACALEVRHPLCKRGISAIVAQDPIKVRKKRMQYPPPSAIESR